MWNRPKSATKEAQLGKPLPNMKRATKEGQLGKSLEMSPQGRGTLEDVDLEMEEDVRRWRNALKEAADLAGMELKNTFNGHEAKFIQQIVQDISLKLRFINFSVDGKLVGMETRVKNVVSSLEIDSDDIRMIGIKGMGGGGKTTLARAVFDHISIWFEGKSFVENVREVSKGSLSCLKELQLRVLSDVMNDQSMVEKTTSDLENMMKKIMRNRKVLVVLDDVDDLDQLEALAGEPTWFKPGSRIIITTRDEQVLIAHRVNFIHDVTLLSNEEAICLFSMYAFGKEIPNQGYEEFSGKVVHYVAGLPLTIKVLGSHLCGRTEHEWVDATERLKRIPLEKTLKRLEVSYNGLENDQKQIFLEVVCILKGEKKKKAVRILECCGFNALIGLRVLQQKSLITIFDTSDCLGMHDHIEEMGWNIVRGIHLDEPSRHSRLWIKEEIEDILVNELGTEATRSIKLQYTNLHPDIIMKGLRKMKGLRYLYVVPIYREWKVDEVSRYLPHALCSLCWLNYTFQSLPKTFQANNLVNLEMVGSNITQLWEGGERKVLDKLRYLDLSRSKLRSFDIGMTPNLKKLDLAKCIDILELNMFNECPKLKFLNLSDTKVSNLNLGMIPYLEKLNFRGCYDFLELHLPVECPKLKFLYLCGSKVSNLNLGMTPYLETLDLRGCEFFAELHLPVECPKLKFLYLCGSKVSNLNLGMTPHLETLDLQGCNYFVELHMPVECPDLKLLNVSGSKLSYLNLGLTPYIERLNLKGCKDFVELHVPVECPKLKDLNLSASKVSNLNLGLTPHLERLYLKKCYYLQEIYAPVGYLKELCHLKLTSCRRFDYFSFNERSRYPMATRLEVIVAESLDICPLHPNNKLPKFQFMCSYNEPQYSRNGNLENLISFDVCSCTNLESFSATICGLQHLRVLGLEGSIPKVPKDLWQLASLERLTLSIKEIKRLPGSICLLKHLKSLELESCWLLEQLPKNIGRLECLEELYIEDCTSLRDFPNSISNMKCLKRLHLENCILVEKLPEELGCLECLEELYIKDCASLRDFPSSISYMKCLKRLHLENCILVEKLPEELGCLECLEVLHLTGCRSLRDIPNSICDMKCLKHLHLNNCILVEKLPEELGCLECLEELQLTGCWSLRDIPNNIYKMKCLKRLHLSDCILLEKLPEELGCIKCLEELNIKGAGISRLPQGIYELKGLRIIGSRRQLRSYGFTSLRKGPYRASYFVER
ncbi:hypothetical protein L1987_01347 [Smallanthus sonchifolius]|uniref:Uncharacterized protein n=1 Tax=Smallanthus sonchifolius TaxID=185202 RepID=A0ACB9K4Y9_9ASTR|nr:hypothetical protein L1987_01347 [Smallanthus sonchifolius]